MQQLIQQPIRDEAGVVVVVEEEEVVEVGVVEVAGVAGVVEVIEVNAIMIIYSNVRIHRHLNCVLLFHIVDG